MPKFYLKLLLSLTCCLGAGMSVSTAQPSNAVYPEKQTNGGSAAGGGLTGSFSVADPDNVKNTASNIKPNNNYALLTASSTAGTSTAWIQLEFPAEVASSAGAPVTVYVRTNNNTTALLGGGVTLTARDKDGNTVTLSGSGHQTYYTPDGSVFLAITPIAAFKYVRVTLASPIALGSNTLQVYYAFYGPGALNTSNPYPFSVSDCGAPNVTTKSYSGLTLGSFDVVNAANAIDDPLNTASSFVSTGAALFNGHIRQTFFFNGPSNPSDAVRVVLSQSGSFVALSLAGSLTLQAYNGSAPVGSATLVSALLDADLLGLLGSNNAQIAFYFAPKDGANSVLFDRVELDLNIGLLGLGLGSNGINIHDVRRAPDVPAATNASACTNVGTVALSALAQQSGISGIGSFTYTWYTLARGGTLKSGNQSWTATGLTTPGTVSYYVDVIKSGSGCIVSSRKKVDVSVVLPPVSPPVALYP
nr:hypothetical protein [uncultured Dyadobacter sp.]